MKARLIGKKGPFYVTYSSILEKRERGNHVSVCVEKYM